MDTLEVFVVVVVYFSWFIISFNLLSKSVEAKGDWQFCVCTNFKIHPLELIMPCIKRLQTVEHQYQIGSRMFCQWRCLCSCNKCTKSGHVWRLDNTKRRVMKNTGTERCVSNTEATVGDTLPLRSPPVVRDHMLLLLYQEGGREGEGGNHWLIDQSHRWW